MRIKSAKDENKPPQALPTVAIFAATDGTGGAGLFADIAAVRHVGCRAVAITTAVTAQNLYTVSGLWPTSAVAVQKQFEAVADVVPNAFKVGVVAANVRVIAECLDVFPQVPVVWDPVISASAGGRVFADKKNRREMLCYLAPRVFVVTPNRSELRLLSGQDDLAAGVKTLFDTGVEHVLVTDADKGRMVRHALFSPSAGVKPHWFAATHRRTHEYHGSGCFFSSTLAAHLARRDKLPIAAIAAHKKTLTAMNAAKDWPALGPQKLLRG